MRSIQNWLKFVLPRFQSCIRAKFFVEQNAALAEDTDGFPNLLQILISSFDDLISQAWYSSIYNPIRYGGNFIICWYVKFVLRIE